MKRWSSLSRSEREMRTVLTENHATRLLSCGILFAGYACGVWAQEITKVAVPGSGETFGPVVSLDPAATTPKPPQISCQGDQLAITADNSTMGSILAGVHACTGVEIQMPNGFAEERTYTKLGPGPTREVLDALLSSTEFNYVIESSNSGQKRILTILLTTRSTDANGGKDSSGASLAENLTMTPAHRAWLASRNAARPTSAPIEDEEVAPANEAPGTSLVSENPVPPQTSKAAVVGTDAADSRDHLQGNDAPDQAAGAPHAPEATAPSNAVLSAAAPVPASPDSSEEQPAAKVLQNKINQMQQLFEERKKMIANPSATPNPN
jgi:hypothetical protein